MSTQRKIYHILKSEGTGKDFKYLPELSISFDLSKLIHITEKVDGSTMQALGGELYKRYDNFGKNNPLKATAIEAERYRLDKCSRDIPAEKHYWSCYDAHAEAIKEFGSRFPNTWLYFEALSSKIGARYTGLSPTIRVFDTGRDGEFLKFNDTLRHVETVGLPVVADRFQTFGDLAGLLLALSESTSTDSALPPHKLEGWVLRQGDLIGKIRVDDLKKIQNT